MHKCPKEAASRATEATAGQMEALQLDTRTIEAQVVYGAESPSYSRLGGIIGALRRAFEVLGSLPIPCSRRPELWQLHLRASLGSRLAAMKVVVALALPAAALRPVPVTMSAAQNRRFFIGGASAAAAAAATKANAYSLPDLPYAYDALEPSIDAATMKFHHGARPAYRDVASRESAAPRQRRGPSQTSTTRRMWRASTASSTRRTSPRLPI